MSGPKKIHVIKLPKEDSTTHATKEFERMPRMYLELLENKEKIKPNLVNKEYDPDEVESVYSMMTDEPMTTKKQEMNEFEPIKEEEDDFSETISNVSVPNSENEENYDEDDENEEMASSKSATSYAQSISTENSTDQKIKDLLEEKPISEEPPPKLSELQKKGMMRMNRHIPNISNVRTDEEEDELKRELLFKFELLKKHYKNVNVPEFSMHSDYRNMHQTYENTVRHMSLESSVENYRSILIGGFMVFEFILGVWMKFDMSGFTQQQILNMNQYERLLIELGEKSYCPDGKQWPVEVRLLGLIVMNAVIFIVSKMILKKTGSNLINMMNSAAANNNNNNSPKPKRKMRGPNVDIDAIPSLDETMV